MDTHWTLIEPWHLQGCYAIIYNGCFKCSFWCHPNDGDRRDLAEETGLSLQYRCVEVRIPTQVFILFYFSFYFLKTIKWDLSILNHYQQQSQMWLWFKNLEKISPKYPASTMKQISLSIFIFLLFFWKATTPINPSIIAIFQAHCNLEYIQIL